MLQIAVKRLESGGLLSFDEWAGAESTGGEVSTAPPHHSWPPRGPWEKSKVPGQTLLEALTASGAEGRDGAVMPRSLRKAGL